MVSYSINPNVTLIASQKTVGEISYQFDEEKAKEDWEMQMCIDLENARKSGDWDLYSDLHKDMFGVRPFREVASA